MYNFLKRIIIAITVLSLIPLYCATAYADEAMQPTEPKPYAYWELTGPESSKKFWRDDHITAKETNQGVEFSCEDALGFETIFGTNKDNLVFETGYDYTVMVKYKVPNNNIAELQMVANATYEGKEAGVYCYRYGTKGYNATWRNSYNPKTGKFAEWIGDFQFLEAKNGFIVVSFHFYIPVGYDDVYLKFQTGESQKGTAFDIVVSDISIFTGYANLTSEDSVSTLNPEFNVKKIDTSAAVLPSEPELLEVFDFKKDASLIKKFWFDSGVEISAKDGCYHAYKKTGANFATLMGTSTAVMDLPYGKDYTIMIKYKNPSSVPNLQFVVNASFDYAEKGLYCMRYSTSDFTKLHTLGYNYKRNKYESGLGDFQAISEDGYTVAAFHFYVANGCEASYFKLQTSEGQSPKDIDLYIEKVSIFKGYADLSKMSDIDGKAPVMHIAEEPPGRSSFLEDVTIIIKDIINKDDNNKSDAVSKTMVEYLFSGVLGVIVGAVCLLAGVAAFVIMLVKRKHSRKQ